MKVGSIVLYKDVVCEVLKLFVHFAEIKKVNRTIIEELSDMVYYVDIDELREIENDSIKWNATSSIEK